jgi:hypothetical protein
LQAGRAEDVANITSMMHQFVEITPRPVEMAERVNPDKVLETIRKIPRGVEVLVLIYKFKTNGNSIAAKRIENPGFCRKYLSSFLKDHMDVKYDGKFFENLKLRSCIASGHTLVANFFCTSS